jgi:hypothetical protein
MFTTRMKLERNNEIVSRHHLDVFYDFILYYKASRTLNFIVVCSSSTERKFDIESSSAVSRTEEESE